MKTGFWISSIMSVAMVLVIFSFSLQDAKTSSQLSEEVTQVITTTVEKVIGEQKGMVISDGIVRAGAHVGLFFVLGIVSMMSFWFQGMAIKKSVIVTLGIGMLTAVCDEVIQLGSAGRAFELIDMAKDVVGVSLAVFIIACLRKIKWKRDASQSY